MHELLANGRPAHNPRGVPQPNVRMEFDKRLSELDSLNEVEKKFMYNLVYSLLSKKKLKDSLFNLIDS